MRVGERPVGLEGEGQKGDEAFVRLRKRSSRGCSPVTSRTIRATGARVLDVAGRAPRGSSPSGSRWVCTRDLGRGRVDRGLDRGGDLVRVLQRELAGKLQVQRRLDAAHRLHRGHVVHLADARDGGAAAWMRSRSAASP